MGIQWRGVVVMAADPGRLSRWWAEVLGYEVLDECSDEVCVGPGEDQPVLSFSRGRPGAGPVRIFLDVRVDDRDAELERLVDMGARLLDGGPEGRLVLADPEGNEFSLLRPAPAPA
jgi:predicted enzyme related to lactoylglutathione lyase